MSAGAAGQGQQVSTLALDFDTEDRCACGHHWLSHRDAVPYPAEHGCVAAGCVCREFVWQGNKEE